MRPKHLPCSKERMAQRLIIPMLPIDPYKRIHSFPVRPVSTPVLQKIKFHLVAGVSRISRRFQERGPLSVRLGWG